MYKLIFIILLYLCVFSLFGWACDNNYFKINSSGVCEPFLTCDDIVNLEFGELIGYGAVKQVYKSVWKGHVIAIVTLNSEYKDDFVAGLNWLIKLSHSPYLVNLYGYCKELFTYVMEFYPRGNALNFEKYLLINEENNFKTRFKLCLNYISIIKFLHTSFNASLVMCDSNDINKTLEQYLLSDDESLVLNDVDALTSVTSDGIICGNRAIYGDFIAPEQQWPYPSMQYDQHTMNKYNEKTDIWKIPNVCNKFLGSSTNAGLIKDQLRKINKRCKSYEPSMRPSAVEIIKTYLAVYESFFSTFFYKKNEL